MVRHNVLVTSYKAFTEISHGLYCGQKMWISKSESYILDISNILAILKQISLEQYLFPICLAYLLICTTPLHNLRLHHASFQHQAERSVTSPCRLVQARWGWKRKAKRSKKIGEWGRPEVFSDAFEQLFKPFSFLLASVLLVENRKKL